MARSMLNMLKLGGSTASSATKENHQAAGLGKKQVIVDDLAHVSPENKFPEQLHE